MTTSFLHFTKDPDEDITNAPQYYHNFGGAAVRIKTYWTTPIWQNPGLLAHSFNLIKQADAILKKYTLRLDSMPPLVGASTALHAKVRAKLYSGLPAKARSAIDEAVAKSNALKILQAIAAAGVDQTIDYAADTAAAAVGLLNFNQTISVSERVPIEILKPLRNLVEPVKEENRLIVVFVSMVGVAAGYTVLEANWLPWIIVDP